jgi:predicted metal-dependent hydrolase
MANVLREKLLFVDDLEVWVLYKNVRSMSLRVRPPDGRIEVSAPTCVTELEVKRFVRMKRDWIERGIERVLQSPMAQAEAATPAQVKEWRKVVQACVPPLIEAWEPILGVKAGKLAYRNMKSRWGSCSREGNISLNCLLLLAPEEVLTYVIVHELCHRKYMDHSSAFWAAVEEVLPDYRVHRKWLKDQGHALIARIP